MVRNSDVPDLALLLQVNQRLPSLFNFVVGLRPVHLVQINAIGLQSPEAGFTLCENALTFQAAANLSVSLGNTTTFCGNQRAIGQRNRFHRLCHVFLAATFSIDGRGINPVDSQFDRTNDRVHGRGLVLIAPAKLPVPATNGPGSQTNHTKLQAAAAERSKLHGLPSLLRRLAVTSGILVPT